MVWVEEGHNQGVRTAAVLSWDQKDKKGSADKWKTEDPSRRGFPNLGTSDIRLDHSASWGLPCSLLAFGSTPGLYPLDASSGPHPQSLVTSTNISRCCFPEEQSRLQLRTLWTAWTRVRDELVAVEKFKHGWSIINKTVTRGECREVQGMGELEHSPSTFQIRTAFRNIPECWVQLLAWQALPSRV